MNKPKLTILVTHGRVVEIFFDQDIFLQIEVHDLDRNPALIEECRYEPRQPVHFTERIPRE